MSALGREAIYAKLAAQVGTVTALTNKVFRRLPPGSGQAPGPQEQPCAFIPMGDEDRTDEGRTPGSWVFTTAIFLYARTDNPALAPGTSLTALVDAIDVALQMHAGDFRIDMGAPTTLGGLCEKCTIGPIRYGEGTEDGQGRVSIGITILVPGKQ